MSTERTPRFTPEGTEEILHELEHGSPDTPERRRMFELAESTSFLIDPELAQLVKQMSRSHVSPLNAGAEDRRS